MDQAGLNEVRAVRAVGIGSELPSYILKIWPTGLAGRQDGDGGLVGAGSAAYP